MDKANLFIESYPCKEDGAIKSGLLNKTPRKTEPPSENKGP